MMMMMMMMMMISFPFSSDSGVPETDPDDESTGSTDLYDVQEPPHLYFGFGCPEVRSERHFTQISTW
jgi:hypothetical protein